MADEREMVAAFTQRNDDGSEGAPVRDCDPAGARRVADETKHQGYTAFCNNCRGHTLPVPAAYGVKIFPSGRSNPYPTNWFATFNGEYRNL